MKQKTKYHLRGVIFFQKFQLQVTFIYCKTPFHSSETYFKQNKIFMSLYYISNGEGGKAVLDLSLILLKNQNCLAGALRL